MGNEYQPPADGQACAPEPGSLEARKITHLAVGCWAYRPSGVSAATRLLYLTPDQVGSFGGAVPRDASCLADFEQCYDPEGGWFGTCYQGTCRRRCREVRDCIDEPEPATGSAGAGGAAGAAGAGGGAENALPTCVIESAGRSMLLGVCVDPPNEEAP